MTPRAEPIKVRFVRKTNPLTAARQRKGISAAELSRRSGVSKPSISRLESSPRSNPSAATVRKLEIGLGLKHGTLVFCFAMLLGFVLLGAAGFWS